MAYQGSTATLPNPPRLISKAMGSTVGTKGTGLWMYASTHVQVDVDGTGFFTDGVNLGMQLGDVVINIGSKSTTPGEGPMSLHIVAVRTSTGVGLSSGLLASCTS